MSIFKRRKAKMKLDEVITELAAHCNIKIERKSREDGKINLRATWKDALPNSYYALGYATGWRDPWDAWHAMALHFVDPIAESIRFRSLKQSEWETVV